MDRNKQAREDVIEKMRQAGCQYPIVDEQSGEMKCCGKKQMMTVSLPILNTTESGQIISSVGEDGGMEVGVPLCDYHCFLAMSTGLFGVKSDAEMKKQHLVAPFDAIHLAESVIDSMVMSGRLQEIMRKKDDAERQVKEVMVKSKGAKE